MDHLNTAVILAGGKSTRMDFDKQTILIQGQMMPLFIADQLEGLFKNRIIISNRRELYPEEMEYPVIPDLIRDRGPKGGIHSGLTSAMDDYVYFIGCDMPFVNPGFIAYMKSLIQGSLTVNPGTGPKVVLARKNGYPEPLNAFYSKKLLPEIRHQLKEGNNKISALYRKEETLMIDEEIWRQFDPRGLMFINLNTASDYEELYESTRHYSDFHPPFRLQK